LCGELAGHPLRSGIGQHPPQLRELDVIVVKIAVGRGLQQLCVGLRRPQEIAEPRGKLVIGDWLSLGARRGLFESVEELR
jgi:hypothetical protein